MFGRLLALLLAHALLLAAPAYAAWPTSPSGALPLCTATGNQTAVASTTDNAGGAFVAWLDTRNGGTDIYAAHVMANGTLAPGWAVNGTPVCVGAANTRTSLSVVAGNAGDLYVVWADNRAANYDIFAQRILSNGLVAGGWPATGLAVTTNANDQTSPVACTDGAGGLYLAWVYTYDSTPDYDIYATRVLPAGAFAPGSQANGIVINAQGLIQNQPDIAADGAGNAVIVFRNVDGLNSGTIWAQLLGPTGARSWGDPLKGEQIPDFSNDHFNPHVIADGSGGAIVASAMTAGQTLVETMYLTSSGAFRGYISSPNGFNPKAMVTDNQGGAWVSSQISGGGFPYYLHHFDSSGLIHPNANGTTITSSAQIPGYLPLMAPEPDGSVVVVTTPSLLNGNPFTQAYDGNGNALWNSGNAVLTASAFTGSKNAPVPVSDGAGGAVLAWSDARSGTFHIYATHVDRFGALGDASPHITKTADVPNDQGGHISVQWTASDLDASPNYPIARYSVWRRIPGSPASAPAGASVIGPGEARSATSKRLVRAERTGANVVYWEFVSDTPARAYAGYSAVVPTTQDSMAASNARTSVRVEAESASGSAFWDSTPDSSYSVDNIPPVVPAPFTGQYVAALAHLHWNRNTDADLAGYRLYRGSNAGFIPSNITLIASLTDTGYTDMIGSAYTYKLTAIDVHGNESPVATWTATGTLGVDAPPAHALAFASPSPNPAVRSTALRFTLPRAGRARVIILDTAGRVVREWTAGALAEGEHAIAWDLTDASGHGVAVGLYFARLEAAGRTLQQHIVVTH